jgi:hypothetical protein
MDSNLKKLLAEEKKKFRLLAEYDFFLEEDDEEIESPADDSEIPDGEDLPDDANFGDEEPELDMDGNPVEKQPDMNGGEDEINLEDMPDEPEGDINLGGEEGGLDDMGEDEVELDVTELVTKAEEAQKSSDEAKQSSDQANEKLMKLMKNFSELENKISSMDQIGQKIEDLQKDIAKRNPTEVEKLEMRSFNSYPYNIKLSDYWNDQPNGYDVDNGEGQKFKEKEEYVLTQGDVENEYSELAVRNTFDYEEEDI